MRIHTLAAALLGIFLLGATANARVMPLWEGQTKTPDMLAADQAFLAAVKEATGGDMAAGYQRIVRKGWDAFLAGDQETAIKRFNQATLINPDRGEAYWGFALATHLRGDSLAVAERWFLEAEKRIPEEPALLADHARILEESGELLRARAMFEHVIALAPTMPVGHIGLSEVLDQLGDSAGSRKEAEEAERLLAQ